MNSLAANILLPLSASICLGWTLMDQSPSNKNSKPLDRIESSAAVEQRLRIDNLIILGQSAPAEVNGDLLLTLVSSNLIANKGRKMELIEQAFRSAAEAREPLRRKSWSRQVDTRSGFKQRALDLELDKLSMQSKAVVLMIPLDRLRARTMFEGISLPTRALLRLSWTATICGPMGIISRKKAGSIKVELTGFSR